MPALITLTLHVLHTIHVIISIHTESLINTNNHKLRVINYLSSSSKKVSPLSNLCYAEMFILMLNNSMNKKSMAGSLTNGTRRVKSIHSYL